MKHRCSHAHFLLQYSCGWHCVGGHSALIISPEQERNIRHKINMQPLLSLECLVLISISRVAILIYFQSLRLQTVLAAHTYHADTGCLQI